MKKLVILLVNIPIRPMPTNISTIAASFPIAVDGEMSPYPTVVEVVIDHHRAVLNETLSETQYIDEVISSTAMLAYK